MIFLLYQENLLQHVAITLALVHHQLIIKLKFNLKQNQNYSFNSNFFKITN